MTYAASLRIAALALVALVAAGLQACSTTIVTRADDIARLTRLSDAWDQAIVRKDEAAIAANMADDFRQIDSDGDVETKPSFVAGLVSADLQIDPYTVEEFEVRLYGDTALLSGRTRMTGRYQGKAFASHYRYIDIYVRRGGVWKIVSVQTTRMAK
jgi:ketosteroid isomerase-like protein